MIKAICFDLDGVFFTPESFKNFMTNLPKEIDYKDKMEYVLYKSPEMLDFKSGKISEEEFWNFATKELGIKVDLENIKTILKDSYEVNSEVLEYIRKIKEKGYISCVCSNNFPTRINSLEEKWGIRDLFDVKVFSYEVGIMKPAKEIFQVLVDKTGVLPQEIVYSDDNESKLQGANELGINTFVYTDFERFVKRLEELGVSV
jgi:putative hydrolase of the HAD superfamily